MKTQEQLGAVHLRIEGLDKERFKKLVEGHNIATGGLHYYLNNKEGEIYIENWLYCNYKWISSNYVDSNSRLITIDELEVLLGKERTPEVIQAEIDKLQEELSELTKVKAGDVVISGKGHIFKCDGYDNSIQQALSGHTWYWNCTKIDPNKTVKEILGL